MACNDFTALAESKGITISFKKLTKGKITYDIDAQRTNQVIDNLIKNSIQAIPYDRESNIQIKITESSKKVKIVVSDNGLGVSAKNREKIFEPKFTTKSDGMGLGLGIVRSIINSHRGKISYKSKNNKGTDFTISPPK